ncbi:MAG: hypothetical protein HZB92_02065 [Euryarchaeota archaeon]|nr:hypothetical protein [Euryarchaeota archaeon]
MMRRETAWRVFSAELGDATLELRGEGERAPTYLVTPLGAKINRVIAVGVITDVENTGEDDNPYWRAKMADPTGTFFISAGQFQPDAAKALSRLKPPVFAAVIGKVRAYSPEPGVTYITLRPEIVKEVDAQTRDYWVLDACRSLRRRLHAFEETKALEKPTREAVAALGYSEVADGIITAIEHYGEADTPKYRAILLEGLRYLLPEYQQSPPAEEPAEESEAAETEEEEDALEAMLAPTPDEEKVLKIIDDLNKDGKGVQVDKIVEAAKPKKMNKEAVEKMLESLKEKGQVYEPKLGRFMRS